jgi:hypothetical protein
MKTTVLSMKTTTKAAILCVFSVLFNLAVSAQAVSGSNGLVFNNYTLISGTNLQKGSVYRFLNVIPNVNATVRIDTLVGGAEVKKVDDNTSGLGYSNAFQPEIKIPSGSGEAYAQFTFTFYKPDNITLENIDSVRATAVDLDGNLRMKEFMEINMGGGSASYMSTTLDISVLTVLLNRFRGENLLGIERNEIDTAAWGNMYTVRKSNINTFKAKFGATTLLAGSANRQYSLYMKGFQYPSQAIILPVKLESFTAWINNSGNKVDLKWVTSSEKNVSHFVVERSTDGKNFTEAGVVFAMGNSSDKVNYSFTDNINTGSSQVIYYRLHSVDNDGKSDYSAIRLVRITKSNDNAVTILAFPNPVTTELRISIPGNWQNKRVVYEVLSANGSVAQRSVSSSGSQTETLNTSTLAPGFYFIKVSCGGEIATQKISKQ